MIRNGGKNHVFQSPDFTNRSHVPEIRHKKLQRHLLRENMPLQIVSNIVSNIVSIVSNIASIVSNIVSTVSNIVTYNVCDKFSV